MNNGFTIAVQCEIEVLNTEFHHWWSFNLYVLGVMGFSYCANKKSHPTFVLFQIRVSSNTFMKSQNKIHEILTPSPAGRVLGFHSFYFEISLMYLRPLSEITLIKDVISSTVVQI